MRQQALDDLRIRNSDQAEDAELPARILIVDDDAGLRRLVRDFLGSRGFEVFEADGAASMWQILDRERIQLVILDVMMPGEDGLSIARNLANRPDLGIMIVSALGSETDRIVGLEIGADDYLAKPVSPPELVARIRAFLRRRENLRSVAERGAAFCFEGWTLDVARRVLRDPANVIVSLSEGEFSLLRVFVERPQRVLNRNQLLEYSRGADSDAFDRAVDTQVSRIRRKLGSRTDSELIRTIRSEGYMFLPKVIRQ